MDRFAAAESELGDRFGIDASRPLWSVGTLAVPSDAMSATHEASEAMVLSFQHCIRCGCGVEMLAVSVVARPRTVRLVGAECEDGPRLPLSFSSNVKMHRYLHKKIKNIIFD